jgi:Na+/H+-dicarboxylate symporter
MKLVSKSLSAKVLIGMVAGIILGSLIKYGITIDNIVGATVVGFADSIGGMFVSLIKLLVVPLVYISITSGICELKDISSFGRLGGKTFSLYIINTVLAIAATLTLLYWLQPGAGINLGSMGSAMEIVAKEPPSIGSMITNIVPSNPFQAFAEGNMLQIIFMAILTGMAIQALDQRGGPAIAAFKMANEVMMKLITLVMSLAPIGVFALMINLGATLETETLRAVFGYVMLVVSLLCFTIFVVYPLVIWLVTGIKPWIFLRNIREQILFALTTASSNATIPVTMRVLTEKIKVSKSLAGFGVPLGATINMSGAAIYMAVGIVFVANGYGMSLSPDELFTLGFTILLLSIGAGGVPGGGIVMIGVLIYQLGLPAEALAIIAAVDRINDMFCTAANVVGDATVTTLVAQTEDEGMLSSQSEAA